MEQKKFIPEGWGGKIEEREFERTKDTSLLLRYAPIIIIFFIVSSAETLTAIESLSKARELAFTRKAPKSILLHGSRGVGKSAVLQQVPSYFNTCRFSSMRSFTGRGRVAGLFST